MDLRDRPEASVGPDSSMPLTRFGKCENDILIRRTRYVPQLRLGQQLRTISGSAKSSGSPDSNANISIHRARCRAM